MAVGGEHEAIRLELTQTFDLVAERASYFDRFTAKLDGKAANSGVVVALRSGEPGRGRNAVAHAVLGELGPALSPEIGRRFGAVDQREQLDQRLNAFRDDAVYFTDAEDSML